MTDMSNKEVAEMVQQYLADRRLGDIYFMVNEERIRNGDNWWRVPVRPSRLPEKLFTFYELLAEVEEEIREKENINILLMTGEPLTEEPAPQTTPIS